MQLRATLVWATRQRLAKSQTYKLPSEPFFFSCLQRELVEATVAGSLGASPWSRSVLPQRQQLPSHTSCGMILSKDFQAEDDHGQEKAIKESKSGVCGGRAAKSAKAAEGRGAGEVSEANKIYQAGIPTRAQQQRVESPWLRLLGLIRQSGSMPCQGRTCLWILFYRKQRGESSGQQSERWEKKRQPDPSFRLLHSRPPC